METKPVKTAKELRQRLKDLKMGELINAPEVDEYLEKEIKRVNADGIDDEEMKEIVSTMKDSDEYKLLKPQIFIEFIRFPGGYTSGIYTPSKNSKIRSTGFKEVVSKQTAWTNIENQVLAIDFDCCDVKLNAVAVDSVALIKSEISSI